MDMPLPFIKPICKQQDNMRLKTRAPKPKDSWNPPFHSSQNCSIMMPPKHENQSSPIDIVIYFLCVYIYKNIKHLLSQLSRIGFFKKSRNIMHMVYFRKALGTRTSKMMIPGVKYKNVQNLICLNLKFWGWLGFSKSHKTSYMWYIFGKPWVWVKNDDLPSPCMYNVHSFETFSYQYLTHLPWPQKTVHVSSAWVFWFYYIQLDADPSNSNTKLEYWSE